MTDHIKSVVNRNNGTLELHCTCGWQRIVFEESGIAALEVSLDQLNTLAVHEHWTWSQAEQIAPVKGLTT